MYKDQIFAIAIIVLLGLLCFYLYHDGVYSRGIASQVVDGWLAREQKLISMCQIDYNQALINEQKLIIGDWNKFIITGSRGG